jgi:hypothetical protein
MLLRVMDTVCKDSLWSWPPSRSKLSPGCSGRIVVVVVVMVGVVPSCSRTRVRALRRFADYWDLLDRDIPAWRSLRGLDGDEG